MTTQNEIEVERKIMPLRHAVSAFQSAQYKLETLRAQPEYLEIEYEEYLAEKAQLEDIIQKRHDTLMAVAASILESQFAEVRHDDIEVTIARILGKIGEPPEKADPIQEFNPLW